MNIIAILHKAIKKGHWPLLLAILFGAWGSYQTNLQVPTYSAFIEFMPKDMLDKSAKNFLQRDLNELMQSNELWNPVLFSKLKWKGKEDFVANYLIDEFGLFTEGGLGVSAFGDLQEDQALIGSSHNQKEGIDLTNFRFKHNRIAQYNQLEKIALKSVQAIAKMTVYLSYDFQTQKYTLISGMSNKGLTHFLVNGIYHEIPKAYAAKHIQPILEGQKKINNLLIENELIIDSLNRKLAFALDIKDLVSKVDALRASNIERKLKEKINRKHFLEQKLTKIKDYLNNKNTQKDFILEGGYTVSIHKSPINTKLSFSILSQSDIILKPQYAIDHVAYPLKNAAFGGVIGIVLIFLHLFVRRVQEILREIEMDKQNNEATKVILKQNQTLIPTAQKPVDYPLPSEVSSIFS